MILAPALEHLAALAITLCRLLAGPLLRVDSAGLIAVDDDHRACRLARGGQRGVAVFSVSVFAITIVAVAGMRFDLAARVLSIGELDDAAQIRSGLLIVGPRLDLQR